MTTRTRLALCVSLSAALVASCGGGADDFGAQAAYSAYNATGGSIDPNTGTATTVTAPTTTTGVVYTVDPDTGAVVSTYGTTAGTPSNTGGTGGTGTGAGGGASSPTSPTSTTTDPAALATALPTDSTKLVGIAAMGAPLADASVMAVDSTGKFRKTTANKMGGYALDITGMTAPFVVVASGQFSDGSATVTSVLITAPTGTTPAVVNITPLTHALAAALDSTGDPMHLVTHFTTEAANVTPAALNAVSTVLRSLLTNILPQMGVAQSVDFISDPFSPDGTGLDRVFDYLQVSVSPGGNVNGGTTLTMLDGNGAVTSRRLNLFAPTPPIPSLSLLFDYSIFDQFVSLFNACFAVTPAASRVTYPACNNFFSADYLNDAKDGAAESKPFFNAIFDNAEAERPRILRFIDAGHALIKLSFRLSNGQRYSITTMAESSYWTGNVWKLRGNQNNLGILVTPVVERILEQNSAATFPSGYTTGLDIKVNATAGFAPNLDTGFVMYLNGPGIPPNSIVLRRSTGNCPYFTVIAAGGDTSFISDGCETYVRLSGAALLSTKSAAFDTQFDASSWTAFGVANPLYNYAFMNGKVTDGQIAAIPVLGAYTLSIPFSADAAWNYTTYLRSRPYTVAEAKALYWNLVSPETTSSLVPGSSNAFAGGTQLPVAWTGSPLVPPVTSAKAAFRAGGSVVGAQQNIPLGYISANVVSTAPFAPVSSLKATTKDFASVTFSGRSHLDMSQRSTVRYSAF